MSIQKLPNVILSGAKNLCGHTNYGILRRLAPQNDIQRHGFRMDTKEFKGIINKFAEMVLQNGAVFASSMEPARQDFLLYAPYSKPNAANTVSPILDAKIFLE